MHKGFKHVPVFVLPFIARFADKLEAPIVVVFFLAFVKLSRLSIHE